jgi:Carboxypeptidase regulatory-like domain/TonB-dependent Receptor Plug Domain
VTRCVLATPAAAAILAAGVVGAASPVRAVQSQIATDVRDPCTRDSTVAGAILGVVRSGTSSLPVAAASIAVDPVAGQPDGGHACTVWSDTAGLYSIDRIAPGTVTMRVSHPGFDTLTVQVTVAALGIVRLDVTLAPKLVVLDSVHVPGLASIHALAIGEGVQRSDAWRLQGSPAEAPASTGEPDVFRVLDGDPNVAMRPEWPAALTDRGGTAGQVLVRIDGLPVWNPVHAGGALAAITPDAVASVTLHDGSMPAEFGDRLTAVVDIDTRDSAVGSSAGSAAIGPAAARAMWTGPLAIGDALGTILVAGRVSDRGLSTLEPNPAGFRDQWADGIATASLASGPTSVRVEAIGSSDRVAPNDALVRDGPIAAHMRTPWQTQTVGMIWTQLVGDEARLASRISTSAFSATIPGQLDLSAPTLASSVHEIEGSTQLAIRNTTLGAVVDALALQYRVTPVGAVASGSSSGSATPALGGDDAGRPMLNLRGQPILAGAYADQAWGPLDGAWQITTGLRAAAMTGTSPRIEPRLGAVLRIAAGVTASAGLARTHQFIQSLRDPDAPYGAQIGLDLPAAAAMGGIPVAQSDAATASIGAQLGTIARLTVDGYARRMSGLAIVSPAHADAFAVYGFDRGSGRVTGGAVELDGGTGRVTWQTAYGAGTTTETFDAIRYHPAAEVGQTLTAATAVHLDRVTQLRVASWLAAGRPAGSLDALSEGHDADDVGGTSGGRDTDDNGGAAAAEPGERDISSARASLPAYMRADIQLRREWRTGPASGRLSTFVTLANVFNHDNVATVFPGSLGAPPRAIVLLPRSLLAGASWTF